MFHVFSTSTSGSATVGATSTKILSFNSARAYLLLVNDGTEDIYISLGAAAVINKGLRLNADGGVIELKMDGVQFIGEVYAICASGGMNLTYIEA
jgi:hypothetical protein